MAADRSAIENVPHCLRRCNELVMQMATRGAIMKGSILTFGIVGPLALTLSATTSFARRAMPITPI